MTFDDFWKIYPRRVAKISARNAWDRAMKLTTPEHIISAAKRYADERRGKDAQYTAHPATWLNGGRWDDYEDVTETTAIVLAPFSPAWDAWRQYYERTGKSTAFMMAAARSGKSWTVPTEWPPANEAAA